MKTDWIVKIPGSKSYMNRALITSALAGGKSTLKNPIYCEDTLYMIKALRSFGVKIILDVNKIIVYGSNGKLKKPAKIVFLGNAGTTLRFLTTFAALCNGPVILDGDKRMRCRPIDDLVNALKETGTNVGSKKGFPPLKIFATGLNGGIIHLNADKSSQFLSSLLLSSPYAKNKTEILLNNKLTSKPYINITLKIMSDFGIEVINNDYKKFIIDNKNKYHSKNIIIEGDASNASYFFAGAAITGKSILVQNIKKDTKQGDIRFLDVLERMGCEVEYSKDGIILKGNDLKGITVDMNSMPDVVPTLAIIAIFAEGKTTIKNVANLRIKECDRIKAICTELSKINIKTDESKDGFTIYPNKNLKPAWINTYNDHRIAMSFAILTLKLPGLHIENPSCVKKSFPDFWQVFLKCFHAKK